MKPLILVSAIGGGGRDGPFGLRAAAQHPIPSDRRKRDPGRQKGLRLVASTGATLSSILDRVTEVVAAIEEISGPCRDPSQGVGSGTETITALDGST